MKIRKKIYLTNWQLMVILKLICQIYYISALDENKISEEKIIGKNVLEMTDVDFENLLEQWEKDDDPLEPDELPEHLRPQIKVDISKMDLSNPDNIIKVSKQGKSVMMFVDVNAECSDSTVDNVLRIWQSSLRNNHIISERYPIDKRRAIFMFVDGAQAVDAKNFIVEQPECSHVTLEGQNFIGKHATQKVKENLEKMASKDQVKKGKTLDKIEL